MRQTTISLGFVPTPSGRSSLVITVTGDCSPHEVRGCIEAGIPDSHRLVFGWIDNDGLRLYEPIPHPWVVMRNMIKKLLTERFTYAVITRKELVDVS